MDATTTYTPENTSDKKAWTEPTLSLVSVSLETLANSGVGADGLGANVATGSWSSIYDRIQPMNITKIHTSETTPVKKTWAEPTLTLVSVSLETLASSGVGADGLGANVATS
jgi:hypothetical protein